MRLVLISDTHGRHASLTLPAGDVLIHAGDFSRDGGLADVRGFFTWMEAQPFAHKILVAGNHDAVFDKWHDGAVMLLKEIAPSVTYLQDSGVTIDGVRFWGSPVQPEFFNWFFNRKRGAEIKRHWDLIPDNTDVMISHGPLFGYLDKSNNWDHATGKKFDDHLGCEDLRDAILRVRPKLHCFGHIHGGYGKSSIIHDDGDKTQLVNASIMDETYNPVNSPVEICL